MTVRMELTKSRSAFRRYCSFLVLFCIVSLLKKFSFLNLGILRSKRQVVFIAVLRRAQVFVVTKFVAVKTDAGAVDKELWLGLQLRTVNSLSQNLGLRYTGK